MRSNPTDSADPNRHGAAAAVEAGDLHMERGELDQAERLYRQAIETQGRTGDPRQTARALMALAEICVADGRFDEAEASLARAIGLLGQGEQDQLALAEYNLGSLRLARRDLDQAGRLLGSSLRRFDQLDAPIQVADAAAQLAMVNVAGGNLVAAGELLRRAVDLNETHGRADQAGPHYMALGQIAVGQKSLAEGEAFFRKALGAYQARADETGMAAAMDHLGIVCLARGAAAEAREFLGQGLDLHRRAGRHEQAANDYGNLAHALRLEGRAVEARQAYLAGLEVADRHSLPAAQAKLNAGLGAMQKRE